MLRLILYYAKCMASNALHVKKECDIETETAYAIKIYTHTSNP